MNFKNCLVLLTVLNTAGATAFGQNIWSASAITGTPAVNAGGVINTLSCDACPHGRGVRLQAAFNGEAYLYLPVTSAGAVTFSQIRLRAEDNSPNVSVRAEFIRQPRTNDVGGAVVLGSVTTVDAVADGFQWAVAAFPAHVLNYGEYSYYIRITLKRNVGQVVTAYDISLQ
jgi:hypothetical protein